MTLSPTSQEKDLLAAVWDDQSPAQGPALDFKTSALPSSWASPGEAEAAQVAQLLSQRLPWAQWVRLYAKPALAVVAASRLAVARGLASGVTWAAPGTGSPFEPPKGPAGVAMLRGDWAPDQAAMTRAQNDLRRRGLMLVVDESTTFLRLAPQGACQYFELEPDVALLGPGLAGGRDFAALVGHGSAPEEPKRLPKPQALAAVAGILERDAAQPLAPRLEQVGRALVLGLDYYTQAAQVAGQVKWEGPPALLRLSGQRLWAFLALLQEEGLGMSPLVMLDAALEPDRAPALIWPRLARACARLRVLPQGDKAPKGWLDAARNCSMLQDLSGLAKSPSK